MRRMLVGVCFSAVTLTVFASPSMMAAAAARTTSFVEVSRGVIVSTTANFVMTSARVHGTLVAHGTATGSQTTQTGQPTAPPCSVGTAPVSGTTITVANDNGDNLYDSYTGTVCITSSTPNSASYIEKATETFTGGTGRFANATGSGTLTAVGTLFSSPQGSQGPFSAHATGTIQLSH